MFRHLKLLIFLFTLFLTSNVNAKPVPPGAGDGDVAANILILVDSSASMGNWIGTDGLGRATGVAYDSQGRILIGQNVRRSQGSVIRYTTGGDRDTTFRPIRRINNTGCAQETDRNRTINGRNFRAASTIKFVEGLTSTVINNENIIFANNPSSKTYIKNRMDRMLSKEPETIKWINGFDKTSVFFDIGANIGIYSLYSAIVKENSVYAFEPHAASYKNLLESINLNKLQNCNAHCIAMGDKLALSSIDIKNMHEGVANNIVGQTGDFYHGCTEFSLNFLVNHWNVYQNHVHQHVNSISMLLT